MKGTRAVALLVVAAMGCGGTETPAHSPAAPTSATLVASTSPPTPPTPATSGSTSAPAPRSCQDLGCPGRGDWDSMCDCRGRDVKVPIRVTWKGAYDPETGRTLLEFENTGTQPIDWIKTDIVAYDTNATPLPATLANGSTTTHWPTNGSFYVEGAEKRAFAWGPKRSGFAVAPARLDITVEAFCYFLADDARLCIVVRDG